MVAPNNSRKSVSFSWQFTLKIVTNICVIIPLFVYFEQGNEISMNNLVYVHAIFPA